MKKSMLLLAMAGLASAGLADTIVYKADFTGLATGGNATVLAARTLIHATNPNAQDNPGTWYAQAANDSYFSTTSSSGNPKAPAGADGAALRVSTVIGNNYAHVVLTNLLAATEYKLSFKARITTVDGTGVDPAAVGYVKVAFGYLNFGALPANTTVSWLSNAAIDATDLSATEWKTYTSTVLATDAELLAGVGKQMYLRANHATDNTAAYYTWIDDVTVTAIPEPSTLDMVTAVGGAILFIRRKFMM